MWRCPVCESEVEHHPSEMLPRGHVVYRCLYCRLELVFDEDYSAFKLAPFGESTATKQKRPKRSRR
jgi:hypothetical protein